MRYQSNKHQIWNKETRQYEIGYVESRLSNWQHTDYDLEPWRFDVYMRTPCNQNIGVLHTPNFIGFDFDIVDHLDLEQEILNLFDGLSGTTCRRIGRKGFCQYFRSNGDIPSNKINSSIGGIDILASGKQSVLPPSIHPDTGKAYKWLPDSVALGDVELHDLPLLTTDILDQVRSIVAKYAPEKPVTIDIAKPFVEADASGNSIDKMLNNNALANLDKWVPELNLCRLRHKVNDGYEAVADWRAGGTGRPDSERKRNLKIDPSGIIDFGSNDRFTAIDLVMQAENCDYSQAWNWLFERVGVKLDPWIHGGKNKKPRDINPSAAIAVKPAIASIEKLSEKDLAAFHVQRQIANLKDMALRNMDSYKKKCDRAENRLTSARFNYEESPNIKTLADEKRAEENLIKEVKNHPTDYVVSPPAGLGKTYQIAKWFTGEHRIVYSAPTNDLGFEFLSQMKAHNLPTGNVTLLRAIKADIPVIKNMRKDDNDREKMCSLWETVEPQTKLGAPLSALCGTGSNVCAHKFRCPIIKMQQRLKRESISTNRIIITTHARVLSGSIDSVSVDTPLDFIILDEDFVKTATSACGAAGSTYYLDALKAGVELISNENKELLNSLYDFLKNNIDKKLADFELMKPEEQKKNTKNCGFKFWLWQKYKDADHQKFIDQIKVIRNLYYDEIKRLTEFCEPNLPKEFVEGKRKKVKDKIHSYKFIIKLLAEARASLDKKYYKKIKQDGHVVGYIDTTNAEPQYKILVVPLSTIPAATAHGASIIILNAKPEHDEAVRAVLVYMVKIAGLDIEVKRQITHLPKILCEIEDIVNISRIKNAPTSNIKLTANSNTSRNNLQKFMDVVESLSESEQTLVVAKEELINAHKGKYKSNNNVGYLSFGKVSGTNHFKGYRNAIVWGYDRLSSNMLATLVGCITGIFVEDRSGNQPEIKEPYIYNNQFMRELDSQRRNSTIYQAIMRLRLHTSKDYVRNIFIVCDDKLDIEFDEVIKWTDIVERNNYNTMLFKAQGIVRSKGFCTNSQINDCLKNNSEIGAKSVDNYIKSNTYGVQVSERAPINILIYRSAFRDLHTAFQLDRKHELCRIAGTHTAFSKYYHCEVSHKAGREQLKRSLRGSCLEIEFKSEIDLSEVDNLVLSVRALQKQLGISRGRAEQLKEDILSGTAYSSTHKLITTPPTGGGTPIKKLIRILN